MGARPAESARRAGNRHHGGAGGEVTVRTAEDAPALEEAVRRWLAEAGDIRIAQVAPSEHAVVLVLTVLDAESAEPYDRSQPIPAMAPSAGTGP